MRGWGVFGIVLLSLIITPVFAEYSDDKYGTSFVQAGTAVTLGHSVKNPTDKTVNASIEFVFENIVGDNYWDTKQNSGEAAVNKNFVTNEAYFIDDAGRFYITIVSKIDGNVVEKSKTEFIVFEAYSQAALDGCDMEHKFVVKPDYSKAVCVFDGSVEKLLSRGWLGIIPSV